MSGDGGWTAAPSGVRDLSLRSFLAAPFDPATWRALLVVVLGLGVTMVGTIVVMGLWSVGGSLLIVLVGIPIIGLGMEAARYLARAERWRMELVDPRPLRPHPYRRLDLGRRPIDGAWLRDYAEAQFLDAHRWRDVVYAIVAFPLAVVEASLVLALWLVVVGLGIGTIYLLSGGVAAGGGLVTGALCLLLFPVAAFVTRGVVLLHRIVVEALLCEDASEALRRDVERLRTSRSAAVELEASELRRIERDLHDGAQQRLVRLAMDLGRAETRIDADPEGARQLVVEARAQAQAALSELRALVRGSAPSILIDRGLVAAVASIAGGSPVPITIDSRLPEGQRFSPAVERAAYFVVSEALANVAKHSRATRAVVFLWRDATRLLVEVRDDGMGGASVTGQGGLVGLRDRVAALDGLFEVVSPPGGPTSVRAALPLANGSAGRPEA
jgi:signal transduction histidine kinase